MEFLPRLDRSPAVKYCEGRLLEQKTVEVGELKTGHGSCWTVARGLPVLL